MPGAPLLGPRNSRVMAARRLRQRRARRDRRLFLAEGPAAVSAAAAAGLVRELFATPEAAARHADTLGLAAVTCRFVTDAAAAALSETVTPQGIVAVAALPRSGLDEVLRRPARRPGHRLIAVLVEPRDPGNAGTVIRTADAAGADSVIFAGDSVDPWSGKCVRASAGSIVHLPVVDGVTVAQARDTLRDTGCAVLAADGHAAEDLHGAAAAALLSGDHAWFFGNEAHGLPSSLLDSADIALRVPVYGRAESLNLAAAAAVCLYESARVARAPGLRRARGVGRDGEEVRR